MSDVNNQPPPTGALPISPGTQTGGESVAELRQEVERLRAELAKKTDEAANYRQAAYAMLAKLEPYVPPTEEELHDMLHGPRGRPILEIIAEEEQRLANESGATDARG